MKIYNFNMDDKLKRKMDEQRERIQSERVAIANEGDPRERERRTRIIEDEERHLAQSLSRDERTALEARLKELEPTAGLPTQPRTLDPNNPKVEGIPWQVNDEYYFLRRLLTGM
jgi:hypothetical protein